MFKGICNLGILIGISGLLLTTPTSASALPDSDTPEALDTPFKASVCYRCDYCNDTAHHDVAPTPNWGTRISEDGNHDCQAEGSCSEDHPPYCELALRTPDVLEQVRVAVKGDDLSGLRRVLAGVPEQVALNGDRQAVQVKRCNGTIIAHIPIGDRLTRALIVAD